jgi:hypothetical protein
MTKLMTAQTTTFSGEMTFGLVCDSKMGVSEFKNETNPFLVIGGKVTLMLANGKEIEMDIMDVISSQFTAFHVDGYEIHEDDQLTV